MESDIKLFLEQQIQPLLETDGGLIQFKELKENGNLYLTVEGACAHCASLPMTVNLLIEAKIKDEFPLIKNIVVSTQS